MQPHRFVEMMQVVARACEHRRLADHTTEDLSTASREMADLSGVGFAGVTD